MVPTSPWGVDADGVSLTLGGWKGKVPCQSPSLLTLLGCPKSQDVFKAGLQGSGSWGKGGGSRGVGGRGEHIQAQLWAGSEAGILEVLSIMLRGD